MSAVEEWTPDYDVSVEVPEFELPRVVEPISEEECYLIALLQDRSGLDIAELSWTDETSSDGCYRAYPYQWPWWRDRSQRQIDLAGRSVGKSESLMARACAFPFNFPGEEMVIVAPEGAHLDAITDRIEVRLHQSRLMKEMLVSGRGGITHRPFKALFGNGARVFTRLPQRSGTGVKGVHPVWLEVDEAQDVSPKTWAELPEVVRWDIPGASWRVHGVSKGIRDDAFWNMSQEGSGFTIHRITGLHKPTWDKKERAQKIKDYGGSAESADFRRNVYGLHGDAQNRIFVLSRLMAGVDTSEGSDYNVDEYFHRDITADALLARVASVTGQKSEIDASTEAQAAELIAMVDLPIMHTERYSVFWGGMDVGLVGDPSEIVVMAEYSPDKAERLRSRRLELVVPDPGVTRFKLLARIKLRQIPTPLQAQLIMHIINHYGPRAFALDRTGLGLPLLQELQKLAGSSRFVVAAEAEDPTYFAATQAAAAKSLTVIKGYAFSEKVVVEIDETKVTELGLTDAGAILEQAGIRRNVKDAATDELRKIVDTRRHLLPYDTDVINQMNGQTWTHSVEPIDAYGRRRSTYSSGEFHILDAMRMFALGMAQQPIEAMYAAARQPAGPVLDHFGF